MSKSSENDLGQQSENQPPEPSPRGGGDVSGKGISEPSEQSGGPTGAGGGEGEGGGGGGDTGAAGNK
jgi:hypothetical protein